VDRFPAPGRDGVAGADGPEFFIRDKQYVIADNQVVIVDEFTGRLMPDRSWRNGLHQAVEAKEELEIHLPKETYARSAFSAFSGFTGNCPP